VAEDPQVLAFVRRGYELWNQGDLAAVAEMWSDDLEWHNDPSWPGQQVYFGREAVVRFLMEEVANVIHLDDIDVESIEPVGDELLIRMLARARGDAATWTSARCRCSTSRESATARSYACAPSWTRPRRWPRPVKPQARVDGL
jgi:hypothetical protein